MSETGIIVVLIAMQVAMFSVGYMLGRMEREG